MLAKENFIYDTLGQIIDSTSKQLSAIFMLEFKYENSSKIKKKIDVFRAYSFVKNSFNVNTLASILIINKDLKEHNFNDVNSLLDINTFEEKMKNSSEFKDYLNNLVSFDNNKTSVLWTIYNNDIIDLNSKSKNNEINIIYCNFIIFLVDYLCKTLTLLSKISDEKYINSSFYNKDNFFSLLNNDEAKFSFLFKILEKNNINYNESLYEIGKERYLKIKENILMANNKEIFIFDNLLTTTMDSVMLFLFLIVESLQFIKYTYNTQNNYDDFISKEDYQTLYDQFYDGKFNEKNNKSTNKKYNEYKLKRKIYKNHLIKFIPIILEIFNPNEKEKNIKDYFESIIYYIYTVFDFTKSNIDNYKEFKKNTNFLRTIKAQLPNQIIGFVLMYFFDISCQNNEVPETILKEFINSNFFYEEKFLLKVNNKQNEAYDTNFSFFHCFNQFQDFLEKLNIKNKCILEFIDIGRYLRKIFSHNNDEIRKIKAELRDLLNEVSIFNKLFSNLAYYDNDKNEIYELANNQKGANINGIISNFKNSCNKLIELIEK